MSFSQPDEDRIRTLIQKALLDQIDPGEFDQLQAILKADENARDLYRRACQIDGCFRELAAENAVPTKPPSRRLLLQPGMLVAAILVVLVCGSFLLSFSQKPKECAVIAACEDVVWIDREWSVGSILREGDRLELSAGKVELAFHCEASATLLGAATFEVSSPMGGRLLFGDLEAVADTPASEGFVIETANARIVDLGTAFRVRADDDGKSHVQVNSGLVEVEPQGRDRKRQIRSGDGMSLEPGPKQVYALIEQGDETAAFRFASIAPPSKVDYADQSQGWSSTKVFGPLLVSNSKPSGPVDVLTDGKGQSSADAASESVFFENGTTGRVLIDLGSVQQVERVQTYTWHQSFGDAENRYRAVQRYTLWGHVEEAPAVSDWSRLADFGWERIAEVDSDIFFGVEHPLDRPSQQACEISSGTGSLGQYRHLLFDLKPTVVSKKTGVENHAFLGEIDVFVFPKSNSNLKETP